MRDIVYFDLETRHSAAEVGGWHNTADMRVSVGVTYSTASGKYTIYSEEMVDDLILQLRQADLVDPNLILRQLRQFILIVGQI